MKSKRMLLLRVFLKASSSFNLIKHTKDKKKRSSSIGNLVGFGLIYAMLLAYALVVSIALGQSGMAEMIPVTCSTLVVAVGFVFTLLKTNGYLFGFREYDILISMPFTEKDIVSAKFLYMYVKSIPMLAVLSLATLVGYLIPGAGNLLTAIIWLVLTFVLPIIPMIIASAIGALIVRVGLNFRHKKLVQTIFTFIIVIPCFFINFIIQDIAMNDKLHDVLENMTNVFNGFSTVFSPANWFVRAVSDNNFLYVLLLIAVSAVLLEVFFAIVCRSYRKINSGLSQGNAKKSYKMTSQKSKNIVKSIAFKEFKRMSGSTTYMVQVGMGTILSAILFLVGLFVKGEKIIQVVTHGAPVPTDLLIPAIPLIVYFLAGMMTSTACSPSLEGKNYWIMKTLPIDPLDDCRGKILFQLILAGPMAILATLSLSFSFRIGIVNAIGGGVVIASLCIFSAYWGLRCGVKHRKLEWDNEIEVVKQGSAVTIYLLPNMFVTMGLITAVIIINRQISNILLIDMVIAAVALLLAALSWLSVKKIVKKEV